MLRMMMTTYLAKASGLNLSEYHFLFHNQSIQRPVTKCWKNTYCYRGQKRDIWTLWPDVSESWPFDAIFGEEQDKRLLSFVTQHRNTYTVGPLDYCGIAKLVHGRGGDVYVLSFPFSPFSLICLSPRMLVCNYDPSADEFYVKRHVLEKETVKLKAKGTERSGIVPAVKRKLLHTISSLRDSTPTGSYSSPSSSVVCIHLLS